MPESARSATALPRKKQVVTLSLPVGAVELLYEVLGHFPHTPGSWSNVARGYCSVALMDARAPAETWDCGCPFEGPHGPDCSLSPSVQRFVDAARDIAEHRSMTLDEAGEAIGRARSEMCPGHPYCSCGRKRGQSHAGPISGG